MKKFLAVFLSAVVIICAFAGCSSGESSTAGGQSSNVEAASEYFDLYDNKEIMGITEKGLNQKELVIPENVTLINSRLFIPDYMDSGKTNEVLEKVNFLNPNCRLSLATFAHCAALTEVTLPAALTEVPESCFMGCINLRNIVLPDTVSNIGKNAFYECSSLENITFGAGVTSIDEGAFEKCTSLQSVVLNEGVQTIGEHAFYDCRSIQSVTIPESVTYIETDAFLHAFSDEGECQVIVTQGSWADLNYDSYITSDENVKKVYA